MSSPPNETRTEENTYGTLSIALAAGYSIADSGADLDLRRPALVSRRARARGMTIQVSGRPDGSIGLPFFRLGHRSSPGPCYCGSAGDPAAFD